MADPVFIATAVLTIGGSNRGIGIKRIVSMEVYSFWPSRCWVSQDFFAFGFPLCCNVSDHSVCRGSRWVLVIFTVMLVRYSRIVL